MQGDATGKQAKVVGSDEDRAGKDSEMKEKYGM
jgi:hypothetical protein